MTVDLNTHVTRTSLRRAAIIRALERGVELGAIANYDILDDGRFNIYAANPTVRSLFRLNLNETDAYCTGLAAGYPQENQ